MGEIIIHDNVEIKVVYLDAVLRPEERERLAALANLLKTDHRIRFDMSDWLRWSNKDHDAYCDSPKEFYRGVRDGTVVPSCNTAACALGHCPLIEGMELTDEDLQEKGTDIDKIAWEKYGRRMFPSLFRATGVGPGELNNLTDAGYYVFGSWNYEHDTQVQVANRILDFLERGYPDPRWHLHEHNRVWKGYTEVTHAKTISV